MNGTPRSCAPGWPWEADRVRESYRYWQSPKPPAKKSRVTKLTALVAPSSRVSPGEDTGKDVLG